jgi:hypothetical protein
MISLTMSRISSRAESDRARELGREVDRLDQRAEDRALAGLPICDLLPNISNLISPD